MLYNLKTDQINLNRYLVSGHKKRFRAGLRKARKYRVISHVEEFWYAQIAWSKGDIKTIFLIGVKIHPFLESINENHTITKFIENLYKLQSNNFMYDYIESFKGIENDLELDYAPLIIDAVFRLHNNVDSEYQLSCIFRKLEPVQIKNGVCKLLSHIIKHRRYVSSNEHHDDPTIKWLIDKIINPNVHYLQEHLFFALTYAIDDKRIRISNDLFRQDDVIISPYTFNLLIWIIMKQCDSTGGTMLFYTLIKNTKNIDIFFDLNNLFTRLCDKLASDKPNKVEIKIRLMMMVELVGRYTYDPASDEPFRLAQNSIETMIQEINVFDRSKLNEYVDIQSNDQIECNMCLCSSQIYYIKLCKYNHCLCGECFEALGCCMNECIGCARKLSHKEKLQIKIIKTNFVQNECIKIIDIDKTINSESKPNDHFWDRIKHILHMDQV